MSTMHDGDQFDTPSDSGTAPIGDAEAEILDRLIESGFNPSAFPADDRHRAERMVSLLGLLDHYPTDDSFGSGDLVQATLHRIEEEDQRAVSIPFRMTPVQSVTGTAAGALSAASLRWRDLMTAAAVILLLISVAAPMLNQSRIGADRLACRANMNGAGIGLASYANDYRGLLPQAQADAPNGNWLHGRPNSRNYVLLARLGFVDLDCLHCPCREKTVPNARVLEEGNWPAGDLSGYAFQHVLNDHVTRWDSLRPVAIMSDVNAVVYRQLANQETDCDESSPCHGGDGMNVLINDGSARWFSSPRFNGDNIWLPQNITSRHPRLTGEEVPVDEYDSMLVQ